MRPTVVSVSGFASEVGKTTVLCKLLRLTPGWEAIKITRSPHDSGDPDRETSVAEHGSKDHADVISDDRATRVHGKDTGRFWEAGASAVQWLIGSDSQIEEGIRAALNRVRSEGVFIEGGSFLKYVDADYSVMVAACDSDDIKSSAVELMPRMNAVVLTGGRPDPDLIAQFRERFALKGVNIEAPIFLEQDLAVVADLIRRAHLTRVNRR